MELSAITVIVYLADKIPYSETNQNVTCDIENGLQCLNHLNEPTGCLDYQVSSVSL